MAPVRLRHSDGSVTTIQVDFDRFTVQDLLQEIYEVSQIPPSLQDLKTGYPPRSLTLIPELPLESLGLNRGEQLIVCQKDPGGGGPTTAPSPSARSIPGGSTSQPTANRGPSSFQPTITPVPIVNPANPDFVEIEGGLGGLGGFLVHRIVPDDNSCLFSSVALVFDQDIGKAQQIRQIVADEIRKDMITWTPAILGRSRDDYISTILKPTSWGGAIELTILANYFQTEIASIDVETGRIDSFTPIDDDNHSSDRCILIYSGIHYDAVSLAPSKDAPPDFHQTILSRTSSDPQTDPILLGASKLADVLRQKKAYTNTATFTLKCEDCGQGLIGEKEARLHASNTGHVKFGEY